MARHRHHDVAQSLALTPRQRSAALAVAVDGHHCSLRSLHRYLGEAGGERHRHVGCLPVSDTDIAPLHGILRSLKAQRVASGGYAVKRQGRLPHLLLVEKHQRARRCRRHRHRAECRAQRELQLLARLVDGHHSSLVVIERQREAVGHLVADCQLAAERRDLAGRLVVEPHLRALRLTVDNQESRVLLRRGCLHRRSGGAEFQQIDRGLLQRAGREIVVAHRLIVLVHNGDFLYPRLHIDPHFTDFLFSLDHLYHTGVEAEPRLRGLHLNQRACLPVGVGHRMRHPGVHIHRPLLEACHTHCLRHGSNCSQRDYRENSNQSFHLSSVCLIVRNRRARPLRNSGRAVPAMCAHE